MVLIAFDGPAPELHTGHRSLPSIRRGETRAVPPDEAARLLRECPELRQVVPITERIRRLLETPPLDWREREKVTVELPKGLVASVRAYAKRERLTFQVVVRALLEHGLPSLGHIGDDGR
jgi:hypothetical protein